MYRAYFVAEYLEKIRALNLNKIFKNKYLNYRFFIVFDRKFVSV